MAYNGLINTYNKEKIPTRTNATEKVGGHCCTVISCDWQVVPPLHQETRIQRREEMSLQKEGGSYFDFFVFLFLNDVDG